MDSLVYTALWLNYHQLSAVCSPREGKSRSCAPRCLGVLISGLLISSSWIGPAQADWGRVIYVGTPPGYALNVRWGPGTNFGVYRKVRRGTSLQATGVRRRGWLQLTDGTWVAGNLVSYRPVAGGGGSFPSDNLAYVVTPTNLALNIRNGPGPDYTRVGQFLNGTPVLLSGRYSAGWAQLNSGNWVDNKFLQSSYPNNERPITPTLPPYNPDVVDLQRRLIRLGYLPLTFVPNGIYDEATQQAVREFQRVNGLPVTGTVDTATWRALYEATEPLPPTPIPPTPTPPTPTPPTPTPPQGGQQMRVVTDGEDAVVFASPDPSSDILRTLPNGSVINTTGSTTGNWTELAAGGWVFSLYLEAM